MLDYTNIQLKPLISTTIPAAQANSKGGNQALQEILIVVVIISTVVVGYNYIQERKRLKEQNQLFA